MSGGAVAIGADRLTRGGVRKVLKGVAIAPFKAPGAVKNLWGKLGKLFGGGGTTAAGGHPPAGGGGPAGPATPP